jgi:hypothetical protein
MNYIVEDDFDFFKELNKHKSENILAPVEDISRCLISHDPLTVNSITLSCKHTFNYIPLYNELCLHNNKQHIICPYCRSKADKLIPYIPLPDVTKIYGVNYPPKLSMPAPKCSFIITMGIYKGLSCAHNGIEYYHGIFCNKHIKLNTATLWTPEKEQLFKTKSVLELKEMLKIKGLKVGGLKKDLVNRLFTN